MLLFGARPERLEKHFRRKAQLPEQGAVQPDQVSLAKRRLAGQGIGLAELFVCAGLQLFQCRRVQPGIQPVRGHEAGDRPGKAGQPKGPRDILPRLVHFKRTQAHKGVVVFWGAVLCAHAERVHQLGYQAAGLGLAEIDVVTVPYCLVGRARPGQGMPGQVDVPGGVDRPAGTEKFQIIPIVEQILQHNRPPEGGTNAHRQPCGGFWQNLENLILLYPIAHGLTTKAVKVSRGGGTLPSGLRARRAGCAKKCGRALDMECTPTVILKQKTRDVPPGISGRKPGNAAEAALVRKCRQPAR